MKQSNSIAKGTVKTPLGEFWIWAGEEGVLYAAFRKPTARETKQLGLANETRSKKAETVLKQAATGVKRYFDGELKALDKVPVQVLGGTVFQQSAWKTLKKIPAGKTWSYSDLASKVKKPLAVRAIGAACRNNPICLFLPCHRVVGKNNSLTGYNGGIEKKKYLLAHEGARGLVR